MPCTLNFLQIPCVLQFSPMLIVLLQLLLHWVQWSSVLQQYILFPLVFSKLIVSESASESHYNYWN